ncbi:MAG: HAD family phosphatase [Clostridia bacterium]|nr:HAD family phosphatase [Clostridia bacterium]
MIKKYKCLVLDHDDTVVDSSASIHYPSFVEYLKIARPHLADKYTLEEYFEKNFHPGILELFTDEIGLSDEELKEEEAFWREYVKNHIPNAYPGMKEIIAEFKAGGGIIAVDSHSVSENIIRDYKANGLPEPDIIYGWDIPKEMRKPAPGTLFDLMEKYNLAPEEILVVDDLKPGYDMARGAGVDIAAAAWAHNVKEIADFMEKNCNYFCRSIEDLRKIIF